MVAAVATLEPEVAANKPQEAIFACINPPGSQDIHCTIAAYMLAAIPARSRISPSRINSGTATRMNSTPFCQNTSPIARNSGIGE